MTPLAWLGLIALAVVAGAALIGWAAKRMGMDP